MLSYNAAQKPVDNNNDPFTSRSYDARKVAIAINVNPHSRAATPRFIRAEQVAAHTGAAKTTETGFVQSVSYDSNANIIDRRRDRGVFHFAGVVEQCVESQSTHHTTSSAR